MTKARSAQEKERAMKEVKPKKQENENDDSTSTSNVDSDSDSDSTSSSSSESDNKASKIVHKIGDDKVPKKRKARDDSSSDSSASKSSSDSETDEVPSTRAKLRPGSKKDATSTPEVQATKKLRTSENGAAVTTATTQENGTTRPGGGENRKNGVKSNAPFQRFDPSKVPTHIVKDNRYEAKVYITPPFLKMGHSCHPHVMN